MFVSKKLVTGSLVIALLGFSAGGIAGEFLTLSEAASLAQRVALVEVTSSDVRKSPSGNIYTYTEFTVLDQVKGDLPEVVRSRLLGGRIGNEEIDAGVEIPFTTHGRYVVFFGPDNSSGFVTVNLRGVFPVFWGADGERYVNVSGDLPLYHHESDLPYVARPPTVPLDDFLHSLRRLVKADRGGVR